MEKSDMNVALIFAGGVGSRMGETDVPKQFLEYEDKPIIIYTLEHFQNHAAIDEIVVVCIEEWIDRLWDFCDKFSITKVKSIVKGGTSGHDSIWQGIQEINSYVEDRTSTNVLVHDGVRPLITSQVLDDNVRDLMKYGTSITAIEAIETVALVDNNYKMEKTVDRHSCTMLRAPQCFNFDKLYNVHVRAQEEKYFSAVDSASLMEYYGHDIHITLGPTSNIKITTPIDFGLFKAIKEAEEKNELD